MSMTIVGGWKCEDLEATIDHKERSFFAPLASLSTTYWARKTKTKVYNCTCTGMSEDDLPSPLNPGNLSLPWKCMNQRLRNPREPYQQYEEVWQQVGKWELEE